MKYFRDFGVSIWESISEGDELVIAGVVSVVVLFGLGIGFGVWCYIREKKKI